MQPFFRSSSLLFFHAPVRIPRGVVSDGLRFTIAWSENEFPWRDVAASDFRDVYLLRFRQGHNSLIGFHENVVAFIAWIARATLNVDEIGIEWKLPADDSCLYDVVTMPEFRGRGIYPAALCWFAEQQQKLFPAGRVWIYCETSNIASKNGIEKAGFLLSHHAKAYRIGNTVYCRTGDFPGIRR